MLLIFFFVWPVRMQPTNFLRMWACYRTPVAFRIRFSSGSGLGLKENHKEKENTIRNLPFERFTTIFRIRFGSGKPQRGKKIESGTSPLSGYFPDPVWLRIRARTLKENKTKGKRKLTPEPSFGRREVYYSCGAVRFHAAHYPIHLSASRSRFWRKRSGHNTSLHPFR
jgi:hypothetical protein